MALQNPELKVQLQHTSLPRLLERTRALPTFLLSPGDEAWFGNAGDSYLPLTDIVSRKLAQRSYHKY